MIKAVAIENFRGIKSCKIGDLSLINLFLGPNNSCKSTIFDAIFCCLKEIASSPYSMRIFTQRVQRGVNRPELFFNYDEELDVKVKLNFGLEECTLGIRINKERTELLTTSNTLVRIEPGHCIVTLEVIKGKGELVRYYLYEMDGNLNPISYIVSQVPNITPVILEYAKASCFLMSHIRLDDLWRDLDAKLAHLKLRKELEEDFVKRLNDVYGIVDYEFTPLPISREQRLVAFSDKVSRVYGAFQGAGIQRAALILATLEVLHNTAIFIEEPEVYQHPEALRKLVKHVVELAKKNNTQLFMTTHSYFDCGRFFNALFTGEDRKLFRCYEVRREMDGIVNVKRVEDNLPDIVKSLYGST